METENGEIESIRNEEKTRIIDYIKSKLLFSLFLHVIFVCQQLQSDQARWINKTSNRREVMLNN